MTAAPALPRPYRPVAVLRDASLIATARQGDDTMGFKYGITNGYKVGAQSWKV
jgi:hypothetical protein